MVTANKIPGLRNELICQRNGAVTRERDGPVGLILLFTRFLTTALSRKRFFHTLFFARLQIKGVTFHFFDNVLLLYFSLEAAKRILEGFPLLKSDFSQTDYTPQLVHKWTV